LRTKKKQAVKCNNFFGKINQVNKMSSEEEMVVKEKNCALLSTDEWQNNKRSSPSLSRGYYYILFRLISNNL